MSRIGNNPVAIPEGVTVDVKDGVVTVKGKNGELYERETDGNKISFIYEGNNQPERIIFESNGNSLDKIEYYQKFNKNKDILSLRVKDSVTRFEYKYDKKKNWIERTTYLNEKLSYITKRKIKYYD